MLKFVLLACVIGYAAAGQYDQFAEYTNDNPNRNNNRGLRQDVCDITRPDILGPYYKPNAPIRPLAVNGDWASLCYNVPAHDRLFLNGTIRRLQTGQGCQGQAVRALMDIWSADFNGVYSNISPQSPDYGCRLRIYTDNSGYYQFDSIYPGRYDDGGYRPAHIHFRITPVDANNRPVGPIFTTQLYFAEDTYLGPNDSCQRCGSSNPSQIAPLQHNGDYKSFFGTWDVVLAA
ncbi:uncharacterized protein LOC129598997 [Paramacrobiotus metropolitanus]|uniref:uncharacterized protein LOC129598997 n=1 Tax=Paramacrobiotus metropolitanus TaxID=2943436 RepID=UPI0024457F74|nr:uncharacterized protein LOC129598997 [Paramacrobiotus metropolitanus]